MMMRTTSGQRSRTRVSRHHVGPALAHPRQQLDARGARHALVAQDHLNHLALEERLGRGRVGRGQHLELLHQDACDRLLRTDLVVDDQDQRQIARVCHALGLQPAAGRVR
jgi:hypothetical protein